jgi:ABC-2 type transport system permease protein
MFGTVDADAIRQQLTQEQLRVLAPMLIGSVGALMFTVMLFYTSWYLLDCLYAERKDRSVLFWKSLPVTDTETVLSKLAMALLVIPLVYFVVADVAALGGAFILSVRGGSQLTAALWNVRDWAELQVIAVYMILTGALWYLPFSGWLLLMSSWARKAVTLWALLGPMGLAFLENRLLGTRLLWDTIERHTVAYFPSAFHGEGNFTRSITIGHDTLRTPRVLTEFLHPAGFFTSVEMWLGVLIGAAFVAGAIYLRHRHSES